MDELVNNGLIMLGILVAAIAFCACYVWLWRKMEGADRRSEVEPRPEPTGVALASKLSPEEAREHFPYLYYHEGGEGCGQPAFRMNHKPTACTHVKSSDACHLDGELVKPFSLIQCDSCGGTIRFPSSECVRLENVG